MEEDTKLFVVLLLNWYFSTHDDGRYCETFASKKFLGIFNSFEEACKKCIYLSNHSDYIWPPHVWIEEITINNIDNYYKEEDINIHADNDFYIVNKTEKCLFTTDGKIKYGEMSNENLKKYTTLLNTSTIKSNYEIDILIKELNIYNNYYDSYYNNCFDLGIRINNKSFVFGLSLEKVNLLIAELEK
jgi:hypothetical protein